MPWALAAMSLRSRLTCYSCGTTGPKEFNGRNCRLTRCIGAQCFAELTEPYVIVDGESRPPPALERFDKERSSKPGCGRCASLGPACFACRGLAHLGLKRGPHRVVAQDGTKRLKHWPALAEPWQAWALPLTSRACFNRCYHQPCLGRAVEMAHLPRVLYYKRDKATSRQVPSEWTEVRVRLQHLLCEHCLATACPGEVVTAPVETGARPTATLPGVRD